MRAVDELESAPACQACVPVLSLLLNWPCDTGLSFPSVISEGPSSSRAWLGRAGGGETPLQCVGSQVGGAVTPVPAGTGPPPAGAH